MGHKQNKCVDCGKNIWDGSTRCKSCARKGTHSNCKIRNSSNSFNDDELRKILISLYVDQNKSQKSIADILGVTSINHHIRRLGIKKDGKYQRQAGNPSYGWVHNQANARYICINGKEVLEHRYVMEQHMGRPLQEDEVVHHINKDRLDNRIENLQLMQRGEHTAFHDAGKIRKGQLTEEGRERKSISTKQRWENGEFNNRPVITEETKKKISDSMKKVRATRFWSCKKINHADTVS
jgi:hypothetical protein